MGEVYKNYSPVYFITIMTLRQLPGGLFILSTLSTLSPIYIQGKLWSISIQFQAKYLIDGYSLFQCYEVLEAGPRPGQITFFASIFIFAEMLCCFLVSTLASSARGSAPSSLSSSKLGSIDVLLQDITINCFVCFVCFVCRRRPFLMKLHQWANSTPSVKWP